jgi:hypothetical protein
MGMKTDLIALINAYAAARASGDALLLSMAAERLQQFLAAVEVVAIEPPLADQAGTSQPS